MPPNVPPIVGAEAIGKFFGDHIKDGRLKNHTFEIVSIHRDGKYAYQVARWKLDVINDKGETTQRSGNTVRVFERQSNGKWLTPQSSYLQLLTRTGIGERPCVRSRLYWPLMRSNAASY